MIQYDACNKHYKQVLQYTHIMHVLMKYELSYKLLIFYFKLDYYKLGEEGRR